MAKRYHPDSGSPDADDGRFKLVKMAHEYLVERIRNGDVVPGKNQAEDANEVAEKDFGIKHKPPQFRQYLSFEGVGSGPPEKRAKQYETYRATRAAERVQEHRIKKSMGEAAGDSLLVKDKQQAKKMRGTGFGFERLVEDMIQESMARGEFNNLAGSGKPLKSQQQPPNPYMDVVTQKINQVLLDNGFAPEWIVLEKEIRLARATLRRRLVEARSLFGPSPLSSEEETAWRRVLHQVKEDVDDLNRKIDRYNLLVPILTKQTVRFDVEKEARKLLCAS